MDASEIAKKLEMIPHPEGGFYKETYRSEEQCLEGKRSIQTIIYFLLRSSDVSRFHRIKSDEMWFFHLGSPLVVHTLTENGHIEHHLGNNLISGETPQLLVTKNTVFGSTVLYPDSFSLVSCSVAPGFDFEDFELFTAADLQEEYPFNQSIIARLT